MSGCAPELATDSLTYWRERLSGEIRVCTLAAPAYGQTETAGEPVSFNLQLANDVDAAVRHIAGHSGLGALVVLLSAVSYLLSKYSGEADVLIGTPKFGKGAAAGDPHRALPLRITVKAEQTLAEFLTSVKTAVVEAHQHQTCSLRDILKAANLQKPEALFRTWVQLQTAQDLVDGLPPGCDLLFSFAQPADQDLQLEIRYAPAHFTASLIQSLARHFENFIRAVAQDSSRELSHVDVLTNEEKTLYARYTPTPRDDPRPKNLVQLFSEQAEKTLQQVAAAYLDNTLTYSQLDRQSNQVAAMLERVGVKAGDILAVYLEPGLEMITANLGILKAGSTILPLHPRYPLERLAAMLADANVSCVLSISSLVNGLEDKLFQLVSGTNVATLLLLDEGPQAETTRRRFTTCCLAKALAMDALVEPEKRMMLEFGGEECDFAEFWRRQQHLEALAKAHPILTGTVGVLLHNPVHRVVALAFLQRKGIPFTILPEQQTLSELRQTVQSASLATLISEARYLDETDRLLWECPALRNLVFVNRIDSAYSQTVDEYRKLWDYFAQKTTSAINDYGWNSSYTNQPFSLEEMQEYIDNFLGKLHPYLHPKARVLDIGCGHGLLLFELAPRVGRYVATDLSSEIIAKNQARAATAGLTNLGWGVCEAADIAFVPERDFDLVVCSAVVHYFPNTVYLEKVILSAIALLKAQGIIYLDDVMDLTKKAAFIASTLKYKKQHPELRIKTEWDDDLFVDQEFFRALQQRCPEIVEVGFSVKTGKIDNELTRYRYDVILRIDKTCGQAAPVPESATKAVFDLGSPAAAFTGSVPDNAAEDVAPFVYDLGHIRSLPEAKARPPLSPDANAYLMYTSGSTGKPKGVLLTHRGIVNHLFTKIDLLGLTGQDTVALSLPTSFVASIWQFYAPMAVGGLLRLYPEEVRATPVQMFEAVEKDRITILEITSSFLDTYLQIEEFDQQETDIYCLRHLILTGERVKPTVVNAFYARYPIPLVNAYGQTECSDDTFHYRIPSSTSARTIPIGFPSHNTRAYILDRFGQLQVAGVPGDLYISGDGLAAGYFQNPELTNQKFLSNPFESGHAYYHTGDMALWTWDGPIECLGRVDRQVKVRGNRIELGEIEHCLLQHPNVLDTVVMVREDDRRDSYLCAYLRTAEPVEESEMREYVRSRLPEYMIPDYILFLAEMPKNLHGKIDRQQLPLPLALYEEKKLYVPPQNKLQEQLLQMWSTVLGIAETGIGINDDFFALGGHSLKATHLMHLVQKEFDRRLPLNEIFQHTTIASLARLLADASSDDSPRIPTAPAKSDYALSSAQLRFYHLHYLDERSTICNVVQVVELPGRVPEARIRDILQTLIVRHESLRTSFPDSDGEPRQVIAPALSPDLRCYELDDERRKIEFIRTLIQPFDIRRAPLLRASLIHAGELKSILVLDMHHLITDGFANTILLREFQDLYQGRSLPQLALTYKDFAEWENSDEYTALITAQRAFWLDQFQEPYPGLELPTDFPRPQPMDFAGDSVMIEIGEAETAALKQIAFGKKATLFMLLLALINLLLSKLTGRTDIVVGAPVAGRRYQEIESLIGVFTNTLPLRNAVPSDLPFTEWLAELRENTIRAFLNQDYKYNALVGELNVARRADRFPLIDVMFSMQNFDATAEPEAGTGQQPLNQIPYLKLVETSLYDLTLIAKEMDRRVYLAVLYKKSLFERSTIERYAKYFGDIVRSVTDNPSGSIRDIHLGHDLAKLDTHYAVSEFKF